MYESIVLISHCLCFAHSLRGRAHFGILSGRSPLGVDSLINQLRSTHFNVQGFSRTYWDFFTGFGLFVTILLLFAAMVSWQIGGLPRESLSAMSLITWGLAICFVIVTFLSYQYFFIVPVIFSGAIAVCLILAAWLAG